MFDSRKRPGLRPQARLGLEGLEERVTPAAFPTQQFQQLFSQLAQRVSSPPVVQVLSALQDRFAGVQAALQARIGHLQSALQGRINQLQSFVQANGTSSQSSAVQNALNQLKAQVGSLPNQLNYLQSNFNQAYSNRLQQRLAGVSNQVQQALNRFQQVTGTNGNSNGASTQISSRVQQVKSLILARFGQAGLNRVAPVLNILNQLGHRLG